MCVCLCIVRGFNKLYISILSTFSVMPNMGILNRYFVMYRSAWIKPSSLVVSYT